MTRTEAKQEIENVLGIIAANQKTMDEIITKEKPEIALPCMTISACCTMLASMIAQVGKTIAELLPDEPFSM